MLSILNEYYYLDLDKMEELVNLPTSSDGESGSTEQHISILKYDMLKIMVDVLLSESEEVDEKLGPKSSELSIPFKLAFNTLINKKIINKY
jgi:hypothetical protein